MSPILVVLANKVRFFLGQMSLFPMDFFKAPKFIQHHLGDRRCEDNKKTMQIYAACCCDKNHTPIDLAYQDHMSCFAHYETNPVVTAGRGDFCDILCCQRHPQLRDGSRKTILGYIMCVYLLLVYFVAYG